MFDRTLKIIDETLLEKMHQCKILLVGVGGVGGFALEALVRLGFQNITIIDNDTIDESNLNRQIFTKQTNIGAIKVEEAKKRMLEINPKANITALNLFLEEATMEQLQEDYEYIIDACDTVATKILLMKYAEEKHIKIISSMGTGNRLNPNLVTITRLDKTYNDPLAKSLRFLAKKNNLSLKIPVVWSKEDRIKIKDRAPGSIILVPAAAGLNIAYYIVNDLKSDKE